MKATNLKIKHPTKQIDLPVYFDSTYSGRALACEALESFRAVLDEEDADGHVASGCPVDESAEGVGLASAARAFEKDLRADEGVSHASTSYARRVTVKTPSGRPSFSMTLAK